MSRPPHLRVSVAAVIVALAWFAGWRVARPPAMPPERGAPAPRAAVAPPLERPVTKHRMPELPVRRPEISTAIDPPDPERILVPPASLRASF